MSVAHMLELVKRKTNMSTDSALCKATGIDPAQLSKMRAKTLEVGPAHLIRLHELTGMPTRELKRLIALEECSRCGLLHTHEEPHKC